MTLLEHCDKLLLHCIMCLTLFSVDQSETSTVEQQRHSCVMWRLKLSSFRCNVWDLNLLRSDSHSVFIHSSSTCPQQKKREILWNEARIHISMCLNETVTAGLMKQSAGIRPSPGALLFQAQITWIHQLRHPQMKLSGEGTLHFHINTTRTVIYGGKWKFNLLRNTIPSCEIESPLNSQNL